MTTKEAILHMDTTIDKYNEGLSSVDIEAIEHLIDIAKRFEGAVEVEVKDEKDMYLFSNELGSTFLDKYTLYAVPKENE